MYGSPLNKMYLLMNSYFPEMIDVIIYCRVAHKYRNVLAYKPELYYYSSIKPINIFTY